MVPWPRALSADQAGPKLMESTCFCLLSAGIKSSDHYTWFFTTFKKKQQNTNTTTNNNFVFWF